jgi:hypothetical protein
MAANPFSAISCRPAMASQLPLFLNNRSKPPLSLRPSR